MRCIDSKFHISDCGCKFLDRDDGLGLLVEYGKDCKDPFHHNPKFPDPDECGHEVKSWEYTPKDVADGTITWEQFDKQKVSCSLCGLNL